MADRRCPRWPNRCSDSSSAPIQPRRWTGTGDWAGQSQWSWNGQEKKKRRDWRNNGRTVDAHQSVGQERRNNTKKSGMKSPELARQWCVKMCTRKRATRRSTAMNECATTMGERETRRAGGGEGRGREQTTGATACLIGRARPDLRARDCSCGCATSVHETAGLRRPRTSGRRPTGWTIPRCRGFARRRRG